VLHLVLAVALFAQQEPTPPPPPQEPPAQEALRVYLDCSLCDFDFFRTEVTFVNYVRDQHDAQVYVLVSTQGTGAGGTEYTLTFIGQREFAGRADTLRYVSRPADTDDAVRRGLAHALKLGLVRFAAQTPLAEQLDVRRSGAPPGPGTELHPHDRWNYWVFSAGTQGSLNGEASFKYSYLSGSLSANRVTEGAKVLLSVNGSLTRNAYQTTDTTWFVSRTHSYNFNGLAVKSLGEHWSAGLQATALSSTYSNRDYNFAFGPAVEFDLFPYHESTRHQLRFNYALNLEHDNYDQVTLFGKTDQTLASQVLTIALSIRERWGTVSLSLNGTEYLHDLRKYDAGIFGGLSVQLVKGLSFNLSGNYSQVHDQLYLPAAGATPDEILVRQRQLATQYTYYVFYGLTYTFGSIYNNVVNPRFGASGSGSSMCMCF
jgi:hypothetical protein